MMSPGDLIVGGGGRIAVATVDLFSLARRLHTLEHELRSCSEALVRIDRITPGSLLVAADAPLSAARAETAIDEAAAQLNSAAARSGMLAAALSASADAYGLGERAIAGLTQSIAAQLGVGAGFLASVIGWAAVPAALAALVGGYSGVALSSVDPVGSVRRAEAARRWLADRSAILSDPLFIQLVRLSVMSADDVGAGLMRIPPPIARLLGDEGLGILGLDTAATAAVVLGGATGAMRETRVSVSARPSVLSTPATSFADRAARIPTGGGGQVRVDRHVRAGPDRFEVYIGGTADGSLFPGNEPWDMTSNVNAIAERPAGSYRAVVQALDAAGVEPSSELVVTGYSQGGLVGSRIAESGDYNVTGLFTLGAPVGQVAVPAGVPWVAVEHTDDLIPAVGGTWTAASDPVLVRREALASGDAGRGADSGGDGNAVFEAHQLSRYQETAAMVDASGEERLVAANSRFNTILEDSSRVQSTLFEARRWSRAASTGPD